MRTKILIIDRDETAVQELRAAFELHGAEVHLTADGEAGIALAERESPALIVLAIELQTTSGYSICKKIKRHEGLAGIPLFITSSTATPDIFEQHKRLKTRAEEYFFKPLAIDQLVATAQNYVPIGGDTTFIVDPESEIDLIEVSDDLIIDDDADVIVVEDDPLDDAPTRVVDANEMRSDVFSEATEAEIDNAIGELTGALGSGDFQVAVVEPESGAAGSRPSETGPPVDSKSQVSGAHANVVEQLQHEIDRLNEMLRKQDEQFAALRTSSSSSKREYHALREEVQTKRKAALEFEDKLYSREKELDALRDEVQELNAKLLAKEQETVSFRSQLATVEASKEEAEHTSETVRRELQNTNDSLKVIEAQAADLAQAHETAASQVEELQSQISTLKEKLESAKTEEGELRETVDSLNKKVEEAEEAVKTAQAETEEQVAQAKQEAEETVRAAEAQTEEQLNSVRAEADQARQEIEEQLQNEVGSLKEAAEKREEQFQADLEAAGEKANADRESALEELRSELQAAQEQAIAAKDEEIAQLRGDHESELQKAGERREETQKQLAELQEQVGVVEQQLAEAQQKVDTQLADFEQEKKELAEANKASQVELEQTVLSLTEEKNQVSETLTESENRNELLSQSAEQLEQENRDIRNVLGEATAAQSRFERISGSLQGALEQVALLVHNALDQADSAAEVEDEILELSAAEVDSIPETNLDDDDPSVELEPPDEPQDETIQAKDDSRQGPPPPPLESSSDDGPADPALDDSDDEDHVEVLAVDDLDFDVDVNVDDPEDLK